MPPNPPAAYDVPGVQVITYQNLDEFAARVRPMLMLRECENCWPLGMIGSMKPDHSATLLSIESSGKVVGAAIQNHPIAIGITQLPDEAVEPLVEKLLEMNWLGKGFTSPIPTADRVADLWCRRSGQTKRLHSGLRAFQLDKVVPPKPVPGEMIQGTLEHLDLLAQWHHEFCLSISEPDPNPRQTMQRRVDSGSMFIWEENGQPRSMTGIAGPTPNGIRINNVYTPPEFRGRGYASNLVAAVSQRILDSGRKFCFLFTDTANPTSNKIYQQIGYESVADLNCWTVSDAGKTG